VPASERQLPRLRPFAPSGRVFREWVAFAVPDDEQWTALLDEAKAFVNG